MMKRIIAPLIDTVTKRYKRWERTQPFSKRQQFVGITGILTILLMLTQLMPLDFRYPMVAALFVVSYLLCAFALRDDLRGAEWGTLLILPSFFTAAVAVFYFLLPTRWLTRLPIAVLYAIGMYALLLTENIYNVAAARTIALLRAAHSVGFLLTLATYFLLVQTVLAYRFYGWTNALFIGLITYPLTLQILWAINLEPAVGKRVRELTRIITLVLFELAWICSLLPVRTTLLALFLTACFYGLAGMGQQYLADRLYKRTVWEFFGVVAIVGLILLVTLNWRTAL
ncbi:MAG: hypothetical protein ACOY3M_03235 [Patescibacteria group bacterium]